MKKLILTTGVALAVAGCTMSTAPQSPGVDATEATQAQRVATPTPDMSTPDRALKSYWSVRDAAFAERHAVMVRTVEEFADIAAPVLELVSYEARTSLFQDEIPPAETFARDILEIDVVTESRAEVLVRIRNTTPVPSGATLTDYTRERRREGDQYRYILEKVGDNWTISEVWWYRRAGEAQWVKYLPESPSEFSGPSVEFTTIRGW